jgi:aldo/keto reductase
MVYKLNNGKEIPSIGFGTFRLKEEVEDVVINAIEVGYKMIDTASSYLNEEYVGNAIKKTKVDRKDLFITGKLWNDSREFEKIVEACKETLKKLNVDYLDLYLVHWPASPILYPNWKEINANVWKALEYLYEEGLVKSIGVSNFKKSQLEELMKVAKIKPMVNQIEFHIGFMQEETLKYCQENDILIEAWSPCGGGKLLKKEIIKEMAEKYNVSPAKLCLRWCVEHGVIPITKSTNIDRMKDNFNLYDFKISKEDMNILDSQPFIGGYGFDSETITIFN